MLALFAYPCDCELQMYQIGDFATVLVLPIYRSEKSTQKQTSVYGVKDHLNYHDIMIITAFRYSIHFFIPDMNRIWIS